MLTRLDIENFRLLKDLHIDNVGGVNLIVGRNNAGKSTVLEAIRIYAGNGQLRLLEQIARSHDERCQADVVNEIWPFQQFFSSSGSGRLSPDTIIIGDKSQKDTHLRIENTLLREYQETILEEGVSRSVTRRRRVDSTDHVAPDETLLRALAISKANRGYYAVFDGAARPSRIFDQLPTQPCGVIPTQLVSLDELAQAWDKVVFTEDESFVKTAIRFIVPDFEALTFIEDDGSSYDKTRSSASYRSSKRRVPIIKLRGTDGAVQLRSFGDGVYRILQLCLKLLEAKNGFMLIDEFENGFHYTVQERIWKFVFSVANSFNIQVFATTHSWDCVKSFATAAQGGDSLRGLLFRVGRSARTSDNDRVIATEFYGKDLFRIEQSDLEVR